MKSKKLKHVGRLAGVALIASVAACLPARAQPAPPVSVSRVSDQAQLTQLLRGDVYLLGDQFPGRVFQRAVLERLRARVIRVRVLTGQTGAAYYKPVAQAGGEVRAFPGKVTGALAIVGDALIVPDGGGYKIVRGETAAGPVIARFAASWAYATPIK